jgi:hypothetical protein
MCRAAELHDSGRSGLLEVDKDEQTLRMHRAVQAVIRAEPDLREREAARHHAHRLLSETVQRRTASTPEGRGLELLEELWPHFDHAEAERCASSETKSAPTHRVPGATSRGAPA